MTTEIKDSKIPLQCLICPSIPKFCDISHLLTHVGSKSHLSYQHKLEIRGQNDPTAQSLLESYREWYSQNGIQKLLADRLTIKDGKRLQIEQQTKKTTAIRPPIDLVSKKRVVKNEVGRTSDPFNIKDAAEELESVNHPVLLTPINQPAERDYTRTPKVHLWSTVKKNPADPSSTRFGLHSRPISSQSISSDNGLGKESDIEIDRFRENSPKGQNAASRSVHSRIQPPERTNRSATGALSSSESNVSSLQLKGIYWPGMNLFDAATIEMKRKRNQKKDPTVLEHMRENSKAVEAKEFIYHANGDFLRTKQFSEEDADEPTNSSTFPTKRKTKRATLGDKSTNTKTKIVKRASGNKLAKALNTSFSGQASQHTKIISKTSSISQRRNKSNKLSDEHSETSLTVGRQVAPKKRTLSIFEDDAPMSASFGADEAEHHMATAQALTEGLSKDEGISESPQVLSLLNSGPPSMTLRQSETNLGEEISRQSSTSHICLKDISRSGKENIEPIYTRDGRIEDNRCNDQTTTPSLLVGQSVLTASQQTLFFTSHTMSSDFFCKSVGPLGNPLTSFQWPSSFLNQRFHGHGGGEDDLEQNYPAFDDAMSSQISGIGNIFV